MSAVTPCTPCCPTTQTVNVPGAQGLSGNNGTNGANAFTATSAQFTVTDGTAQTISVLNSSWMAIGELVFISDGTHYGTFQVTAIPTTTSVTVAFLAYPGDTAVAFTVSAAAVVTPTGKKFTAPTPQTVYSSGTAYEMTATPAQLALGTNPPTLTLASTGTFLILAQANVKFLSVTWAANHTMDLHLRRTNNTAADLSPAMTITTPIITTITDEFGLFSLAPIAYIPAQAGDVIELWGSLSAVPDNNSAGAHVVQVTQASIVAVQIA